MCVLGQMVPLLNVSTISTANTSRVKAVIDGFLSLFRFQVRSLCACVCVRVENLPHLCVPVCARAHVTLCVCVCAPSPPTAP